MFYFLFFVFIFCRNKKCSYFLLLSYKWFLFLPITKIGVSIYSIFLFAFLELGKYIANSYLVFFFFFFFVFIFYGHVSLLLFFVLFFFCYNLYIMLIVNNIFY
jgi:hypothetical protein